MKTEFIYPIRKEHITLTNGEFRKVGTYGDVGADCELISVDDKVIAVYKNKNEAYKTLAEAEKRNQIVIRGTKDSDIVDIIQYSLWDCEYMKLPEGSIEKINNGLISLDDLEDYFYEVYALIYNHDIVAEYKANLNKES